jgi:hypothetical protein
MRRESALSSAGMSRSVAGAASGMRGYFGLISRSFRNFVLGFYSFGCFISISFRVHFDFVSCRIQ